jgi:phosphohistidine swiveling domain-containing protein
MRIREGEGVTKYFAAVSNTGNALVINEGEKIQVDAEQGLVFRA